MRWDSIKIALRLGQVGPVRRVGPSRAEQGRLGLSGVGEGLGGFKYITLRNEPWLQG